MSEEEGARDEGRDEEARGSEAVTAELKLGQRQVRGWQNAGNSQLDRLLLCSQGQVVSARSRSRWPALDWLYGTTRRAERARERQRERRTESLIEQHAENLGALVSLELDDLSHRVILDNTAVAGKLLCGTGDKGGESAKGATREGEQRAHS